MKEFKTASGTIKIKNIIPLNTWQFPIEVNGRIKTIKKILEKEPFVKGIVYIKRIAFFDGELATQLMVQPQQQIHLLHRLLERGHCNA